ncbi:hypothetical protein L1987_05286 [Smallanthus sonchifolius]|uniref:Uncharacterized protein n=1 Tax=Smallanthus sonchifolius TaxID=185202 RepID=A0ACB9JUY5_9ASTR|nr:hypothetical protein L1987_05286 [Smallanthus sonchifolius]
MPLYAFGTTVCTGRIGYPVTLIFKISNHSRDVAKFTRVAPKPNQKGDFSRVESGYAMVLDLPVMRKSFARVVSEVGKVKTLVHDPVMTKPILLESKALMEVHLMEVHLKEDDLLTFQDEKSCIMGNVYDIQCIENLVNLS